MALEFTWACPRCGAEPQKHGNKRATCHEAHHSLHGQDRDNFQCQGFLCDCDILESLNVPDPLLDAPDHGRNLTNPCKRATCYCCGWVGTFPVLTGLKPWEKAALAAGWTPPDTEVQRIMAERAKTKEKKKGTILYLTL